MKYIGFAIITALQTAVASESVPSELKNAVTSKPAFFVLRPFESYTGEGVVAVILLCIIAVGIWGRQRNQRLAEGHANSLLRPGGPLEKNFASLSGSLLMKDGPDLFRIYVTGRRHCIGAQLTLRMAKRQDVLAIALNSARTDILDIEIAMNEAAMPMTAFFIGSSAAAKVVMEENDDLARLTKAVIPAKDRLPGWPEAGEVLVHAEHAGVLYDAVGTTGMELVFGPQAFQVCKKYFRYLYASSEYKGGQHSRMVRLSVTLPPLEDADVILERFIGLVMHVVDSLAAHKLTPEQIKRATEARRRVDSTGNSAKEERERRAEERRAAKEAEEKARLARLPPDQREKEKARRERIQRERKMRQLMRK
jgi:hypothetical protein